MNLPHWTFFPGGGRRASIAVVGLAAAVVAWAAVNLLTEGASFVVLIVDDEARVGDQAAMALTELFGAFVLSMFPAEEEGGGRLRWMAGGFAVLGLGHLLFGYVGPNLTGSRADLNQALYEGMLVGTLAGAFFVMGVVPKTPPRLSWRVIALALAALAVAYVFVFEMGQEMGLLPTLTRVESPEEAAQFGDAFSGQLTPWYWSLDAVPLALAVVALVGALRQSRRGALKPWLLVAMVLFAGAQLHGYPWPTPHASPALTSGEFLRFAFAATIVVGGVIELRRIAAERSALLGVERENTRRLSELASLRADFTAMVAHELGSPLAAVRRLAEMLSAKGADPQIRSYATAAIEGEVDALNTLVADVQSAAWIERDDFKVMPRPVSVAALLADAEAYGKTLPGGHPLKVVLADELDEHTQVWADPERVGQALRNLLSNAAKYSSEGAPVELRAKRWRGGRVRIEVADRGTGIRPEDVSRIFEKFGRGRDREGRKVPGVGLGLYLSRRIVRAHGSDLTVDTEFGEGSVFGFELEIA